MIDPTKIVDNMNPPEYRFKKCKEFSEAVLPATKYGEEYTVVRQIDESQEFIIDDERVISERSHYYILSDDFRVIGRFDVHGDLETTGITYHIVEEFQNRGIGQTALKFVVDRIFEKGVNRIVILAVNDRSAAIASKAGFTKRTQRTFEMRLIDYQQSKSNGKTI